MNPEEWPAGFAKRTEVLVGQDQEEIKRWSSEEVGEVAVRSSGSFRIGVRDGISYKYCTVLQRADGYDYQFLPAVNGGVSLEESI